MSSSSVVDLILQRETTDDLASVSFMIASRLLKTFHDNSE